MLGNQERKVADETKITVYLTEEEAILFALFRKHQTEFTRLLKEGLFTPYKGKMVVHKDGKVIRQIEFTIIHR